MYSVPESSSKAILLGSQSRSQKLMRATGRSKLSALRLHAVLGENLLGLSHGAHVDHVVGFNHDVERLL